MENKTKIILTRKPEWMNRARAFKVIIDGTEKGRITSGSTEEFVINPGQHQVLCKLGWCTSPVYTIDIKEDEIAYLKVQSNLKYYWPLALLLFAGLIVNLYYSINGIHPKPIWASYLQLAFMLPVLGYVLYKVTFARKDYLFLGEDADNVFAN